MRTERALAVAAAVLSLAASLPASAQEESITDPARFSVGLAFETHVIGAARGIHPELLWQPFADDGAMNVVASAGFLPGAEYLFVPVDLGVRWVWKPWWFFQPQLGVGVEEQGFFVEDGGPFFRTSFMVEAGAAVAVNDALSLGALVVPSLSPFGVPGPGLAGRLTLTLHLR